LGKFAYDRVVRDSERSALSRALGPDSDAGALKNNDGSDLFGATKKTVVKHSVKASVDQEQVGVKLLE